MYVCMYVCVCMRVLIWRVPLQPDGILFLANDRIPCQLFPFDSSRLKIHVHIVHINTYIHQKWHYLYSFIAASRVFLANSCPCFPSIIRFRSFTAFLRRLTLFIALFPLHCHTYTFFYMIFPRLTSYICLHIQIRTYIRRYL